MCRKWFCLTAFLIGAIFIIGCSGGGEPMLTPSDETSMQSSDTPDISHSCWGMWQFVCDPEAGTVDVVKLRDAGMHLNALKFLEPPANLYLTLESPPEFSGGVLDVDIGLRHPFLGLHQFTGFDVCGILISHGSITGFESDPHISLPGEDNTGLLNADGYTRWWNPTEFPPNPTDPMFGYQDGLLGTPHETADFTATLNGYKYFADGLEPNSPVSTVNPDSRGVFSAGQKNIRHYKIDLGGALIFNYAVDANWMKPVGSPPYHVPDDFPQKANRPEAWNISVMEIENTLAYEDGIGAGHLLLGIDVYDWFNAELNEVVAESLAGIAPVTASTPIGGGAGYSTYELDLPGVGLTQAGEIDLLITVRSEKVGYQGLLPGETICAYFIHATDIEDEIIPELAWVYDDEKMVYGGDHMSRSPSILQRTAGDIDIGFARIELSTGAGHKSHCHMLTSSDNGENIVYAWKGAALHAGQTLKYLKACHGPSDYTVFMYQTRLGEDETPYDHASTARDPDCPLGENQGLRVPWTDHSDEVIWAADDKIVCFGDRGSEIMYKKGSHANSLFYNHNWSWSFAPEITIVPSPARLSIVRSICKDENDAIYFAYFGGEGYPWIKIAINADGLGTDWDTSIYITPGLTDEYASRIEPSLVIDPDGMFHATFVGEIAPMYSVLYTSSENGSDWSGYNPIYTNPDSWLGEVTVDAFLFGEHKIIVISFEMDGDIWFLYSFDGGESFAEPVLISDGTGNAVEPDIRADAQGYVHFTWSQFKEEAGYVDDYDIHYRRAHIE